ncbi:MAG TPA: Calx-beta domain-containing protein [Gemmataceae bacterium]|nr:Calx-beta domain-containing protein [Gemmataceae bacterium]
MRLRLDALERRDVPAIHILVSHDTPNVSASRDISVFSTGGSLLSTRTVPPNPQTNDWAAKDVARTADGRWVVFNGTFNPSLAIYNPANGSWKHAYIAGWSTVSNMSYGGVTTAGKYAFAPDMFTYNGGEPKGIVRFDLDTLVGTRYFTNNEYTDLNIGLDGNLYGLRGDYGPIDVIDPVTMTLERTVDPGNTQVPSDIPTPRGVTADAAGNIFVVDWDCDVFKLDPVGNHLATVHLDGPGGGVFFSNTHDIDISNDGTQLLIGSRFGYVTQMTTSFTNITYFQVDDSDLQVAFDEPPPALPVVPDISVDNPSMPEGDSGTTPMTFKVTLSAPTTRTVTVQYTTQDGTATAGSDYTATSGTLTFDPGQTTKTVTVDVLGDLIDEPDETVNLVLSGAINGALADDTGVGTIRNDEITPDINVTDSSVVEGDTSATMTFNLSLSQAANRPVTVQYATQADTATADVDYTESTGSVTFNPGETSKPIDIPVIGDLDDEPDETFKLVLSTPTNGIIVDGVGIGLIRDDDGTPVVTVADPAPLLEGNTGTKPVTFNLSLNKVPKTTVSFDYTTQDGSATGGDDFNTKSGTVTFAAGQTQQTVTVDIRGDWVAEPDETFDLVLSNPISGAIGDGTATATIANDDVPPIAKAGVDRVVNEGGTLAFSAAGSSGVAPLTYTWDFGDGTTATGNKPRHKFRDSGIFTVTLTVNDGNGSIGTDIAVVTSKNLAPKGGFTGPAHSVPGWARALNFFATDSSPVDAAALSYRIDWGDGHIDTLTAPGKLATGHAYATAGTYTVRFVASDKDGGQSAEVRRKYVVKPVLLEAGTLYVPGTDTGDAIEIRAANAAGTKVDVAVNGAVVASGSPTTVAIFARDGDDTVTTVGAVQPRLILMGGAGNDTLNATTAIGPTVLVGGAGDDTLTGGAGRNILIGDAGADVLIGGGNDDVAIGGAVAFDNDPLAMRKLSKEWSRTNTTYEVRRDHLFGSLTKGMNGPYLLAVGTVNDDNAVDHLTGVGGRDWFFDSLATPDTILDAAGDETVTRL